MVHLRLADRHAGAIASASAMVLLFSCQLAWADNTLVQFDEVLAGANGDSRIQFIEIKHATSHNQWGPPGVGLPSRAELAFFDSRGVLVGEFDFPSNPPQIPGTQDPNTPSLYSALIGTREFSEATGLRPDFFIPASVVARAGLVCFRDNDGAFPIDLCVSYGDNQDPDVENGKLPYVGPQGNEGPPADALPITDAASLRRFRNFDCVGQGCHTTRDFVLKSPSPRNGGGQTATITVAPTELQGKTLFNEETFLGNGRSCFTCHRPQDGFGLNPSTIAALPPNDPLFIAEIKPEELGELENPCLMKGGRALILENVHGFDADPVFRNSIHLMNVGATAPYGWSPEFGGAPDLVTFAQGAIKQHFPNSLPRNFDPAIGPITQRTGTVAELTYMRDFQVTIKTKVYDGLGDLNTTGTAAARDENLDRLIAAYVRCNDTPTLADIEAGRFLAGRFCIECHVDPLLGSDAGFEIGIGMSNHPANQDDGCIGGPFDPTLPLPSEQEACEANPDCDVPGGPFDTEMDFGIRPLVDIARVKEVFFKGGEAATLRESVEYYTTDAFRNSEAGVQNIELDDTEIDQLTAFLQAIVETPPCSGACCLREGVCEDMSDEAECIAACGSWHGLGSLCENTVCGSPRQACCRPAFVGYICQEMLPCECLEIGGEPLGDGTFCEPDTCTVDE